MSSVLNTIPSRLPVEAVFKRNLQRRHLRGSIWRRFFLLANIIALLALIALFMNVIDRAFGLVATQYTVTPESIIEKYGFQVDAALLAEVADDEAGEIEISSTVLLEELTSQQLATILLSETGNRIRVILRDNLSNIRDATFTSLPLSEAFPGARLPEGRESATINDLTEDERAFLLTENFSQSRLVDLTIDEVLRPRIVGSWSLSESLFQTDTVLAQAAERYPDAEVTFKNWVSLDFISSSISSSPTTAGLRTAMLGTIWVVLIALVVSLPLGVGAAIYLEEYASNRNWFERLIQTNIRNLA
ncbi:hypothetical protein FBR02_17055, partial [Anaerolineae bacterium CFX9]|nr:hypothetical protein [Anaerolineae bacterium CFX9]